MVESQGAKDPVHPWANTGNAKGALEVADPEEAWRIAPEEGRALLYFYESAPQLLTEAFQKGWEFSARIRLDTKTVFPVDRYAASLAVENKDAGKAFVLHVCADDKGLFVRINREMIRLPELQVDAFHDYAMTYDAASGTVSIEVDGQPQGRPVAAERAERWFLRWGHTTVSVRSAAERAKVRFEVL